VVDKVTVIENDVSSLQGLVVVDQSNLSVGQDWLKQNTTAHNTAIGYQALHVSKNDNNTALGCQALTSLTSGYLNTALGTYSMYYTTEGINNTAVGFMHRK